MIHLSVKLGARIVPGINGNLQQQDVSSSCLQRRLKFLKVIRHTVIKLQDTCTMQLANSIVFKCLLPKPNKIGNKIFIMPL